MTRFDPSDADDLRPVSELLRARRPEATALELDAVKQRVQSRVAARPAGRRARSADLMKSRLAILSMLVAGMLLSGTGASLAVTSGLTSGNDASVVQYGPSDDTGQNDHGDNPGRTSPDTVLPNNGNGGNSGRGNHSGNGGTPTQSALQPAQQVEAGSSSGNLPFTGYLAIPVLLGGVALLAAGLVLRRRVAADRA